MKLNKIRIKDIGRVVTGTTPPTKNKDYYGNEYNFIKPSYIEKGIRYFEESEVMLSEASYEKYKNTFIPKHTTCVVTIGSIGEKICLTKDISLTNQQINSVIAAEERFDKIFVYYLLKHNLYKVKAANTGSSSGRENVSKSVFENIELVVPDLQSQKKIGGILSAYDSLIENNTKRIQLLEEIAGNIYKEWFVNFRFIGYEKCSIKDGVPEGWEKRKVLQDYNFIKGIEPGTSNYSETMEYNSINFLRVGDLGNRDSKIFIPREMAKEKILVSEDIVISLDGTVGVVKFGISGAYSSAIRKVESKDEILGKMFTYCLLRSDNIQNTIKAHARGTTILHASGALEYLEYVYPEKLVLENFNKICDPIFLKIVKLQESIEKLKEARDILIQKLITGEIEV